MNFDTYAPTQFARLAHARAVDRGYEDLSPGERERVVAARAAFKAFCEYCFETEDGSPIDQQPFQQEWFEFETQHDRTVLFAPVEHGKSKTLTVWRKLWRLGHNHNGLHAIISESARDKAWRFLAEIKENIRNNVRLHRVFPDLRPGAYWRQHEIAVERSIITKDPTIQALGCFGAINGARLDEIDIDDLLSFKNTYSETMRRKVLDWLQSEVFTRTLKGGEIHLRGTTWDRRDAYHILAEQFGFKVRRYTAVSCSIAELRTARADSDLNMLWPAMWSRQRLQQRLLEIGSVAFSRTMLNKLEDPESQHFREEWIQRGLELGRGLAMVDAYSPRAGEKVACGHDLAASESKTSKTDSNVMITVLWDKRQYRPLQIVRDREKRWTPDEHLEHVERWAAAFPGATLCVESNLGQVYFARWMDRATKARVEPVFTGREKNDPVLGIEGIALMLERGQLALPCDVDGDIREDVAELVQAMRDYRQGDHPPDVLAAFWFAFQHLGGVQGSSIAGARFTGRRTLRDRIKEQIQ